MVANLFSGSFWTHGFWTNLMCFNSFQFLSLLQLSHLCMVGVSSIWHFNLFRSIFFAFFLCFLVYGDVAGLSCLFPVLFLEIVISWRNCGPCGKWYLETTSRPVGQFLVNMLVVLRSCSGPCRKYIIFDGEITSWLHARMSIWDYGAMFNFFIFYSVSLNYWKFLFLGIYLLCHSISFVCIYSFRILPILSYIT